MKYSIKKVLPVTLAILALVVFVGVTTIATHVSTVSLSPTSSQVGTVSEFRVLVQNQGGDSITNFELVIPETSNLQPYYIIKEVYEPGEWKVNRVYRVDPFRPYKLSWNANDGGIKEGESLEFIFKAEVPTSSNQFSWTWKTIDSNGGIRTGIITTTATQAPFSTFKVTSPKSVKAGEYFQVTVTAVDSAGNVKTDYIGSVSFATSDPYGIVAKDYTFSSIDQGSKGFTFKMKTVGDQSVTIKSGDLSVNTNLIAVKPGYPASIKLSIDKSTMSSGDTAELKVTATDVFDNQFDVTSNVKFETDKESGGKFVKNVYTAGKSGHWTVIATYYAYGLIYKDGVPISIDVAPVTPTTPTEPTTPVTPTTPTEPTTPPEVKRELSVSTVESIVVEPGKSVNFNVTVKNTGNVDLSNVGIQSSGIPETWIASVPTFVNIPADKSQNYLVSISAPQGESGVKIVTITAKSVEGINVSKTISLSVAGKSGVTGFFLAVLEKPLYVGLIIVVLIIVILVIWKLVPGEDRRKKSEE